MGKIRSAWEIALERTQDISIDKDKIKAIEKLDSVRKAIGAFLNDDNGNIDAELSGIDPAALREAVSMAVASAISLNMDAESQSLWDKLRKLLSYASDSAAAADLLEQIAGYIKQYPEHRKTLLERMKAQYQPMLDEKEAEMRKQYGQDVHLSLDTDKEFLQIASQNLKKLEEQYEATIQGAKDQLKALILGF